MAEHCRNWKGEERCGKPAEFIVWGKLFPRDALGPRCYDCAADQVGHHGLCPGNPQAYAIYHLNDVDNSMAQRDTLLSAAKQWRQATESRLRLVDRRGEAADSMLPADRALCEAIERVES